MGSLDKKFKIGIVAGEQSGDQLGASLIQKIKEIEPSVEFVGVGGPQMTKEGLNSFFDMKKISVMGIVEPLKNLKEILSLRKDLKEYLINQQIDLFIELMVLEVKDFKRWNKLDKESKKYYNDIAKEL